jgi:hypothetical protein
MQHHKKACALPKFKEETTSEDLCSFYEYPNVLLCCVTHDHGGDLFRESLRRSNDGAEQLRDGISHLW